MTTLKFDKYTAPVYWASYFINGDDSGLEPDEKARADAWLERENVRPVSMEENSERFTWHYQLYDTLADVSGGEVADYICQVLPRKGQQQ